ncbi:Type I restriction enzyme EcoKI M protein [Limihaloglobus sulfuriphilus]|uniref:site-specific DNA-methyltransferase (adenine-specific) n=1 Tax=Limihaloglobus sulfuriphilus TaxID=1851148 RepID=A0A1Q2MDN3_9BACT|nr:type I restriction-modification system subunit M [Limihaloglobus sulfuriphilus]AQQ70759.1 Type I restriction enzyme EcoKI M protein [Limihaloglobus sulfuriphilus]
MAIKKSELYSSLWKSCDELRGGMDASQYKDYVLVLLFIKYISDKYAGVPFAPITVPEGASFKDMAALKGKSTIGDDINKKIIGRIAEANNLTGTITVADFNSADKLGSGSEMVKKLTNLIAIFENPALDFAKNRAGGDDILGDAYEYLMRHFATESGKSKGQFYTPAEVSRIMAKVIGVNAKTGRTTTVYDPTCGSGSLLLKVADETEEGLSIYGQENDTATAGLARMNMVLHNNATAVQTIKKGNTLANPLFTDEHNRLKTFDYVVANPPFSYKSWSNGVDAVNDIYGRFKDYGIPPSKNGDYAFLLHIIKSLKSRGKGACILPHGVLFRGNAEAQIRTNLIRRGYIKGIIGLPANLFFGTGIPACIIVIDKENAQHRKGIFMIDASKGFIKDGNKNRLREQDIHRIVDVFNKQTELDKFSRMVPVSEIEANDFNLNIPRYIDSQEPEDTQNIEAHLSGGIPKEDIDALEDYWKVYPTLKKELFSNRGRKGLLKLKVKKEKIKQKILSHPEFTAFSKEIDAVFDTWKERTLRLLKGLGLDNKPKEIIYTISEDILSSFTGKALIDKYDVYQHLMNYWAEVMQDDCYIISSLGWKAELSYGDKGKTFECDLVPVYLVIDRYFPEEKKTIEGLEVQKEALAAQITEITEEYGGEDGYFSMLEKINKGNVQKRAKEIKDDPDSAEEIEVLTQYLELNMQQAALNKIIKIAKAELDKKVVARYKTLTEDEIKVLVVDDKWMAAIERNVKSEMDRISQRLTQRIRQLAERYETSLPMHNSAVTEMEERVAAHLEKMGFVCK